MNLRIKIWNANGLSNHKAEVETFVNLYFIDIFLISETPFNKKYFFKINGFDFICCNHPHDRCHIGSAIIVKSNKQYYILDCKLLQFFLLFQINSIYLVEKVY